MMARAVYRVLLRLHPAAFRERFADEMLWVFDQSEGGVCLAVRDGTLSLVTQWMATDEVPHVATPFAPVPVQSFPTMRLAQATMLAALVTLGFFKLLTQSVPLPQTPKDFSKQRRAAWFLCRVYKPPVQRHPGDAADCEAQWTSRDGVQ